jgi:hypothetical protein
LRTAHLPARRARRRERGKGGWWRGGEDSWDSGIGIWDLGSETSPTRVRAHWPAPMKAGVECRRLPFAATTAPGRGAAYHSDPRIVKRSFRPHSWVFLINRHAGPMALPGQRPDPHRALHHHSQRARAQPGIPRTGRARGPAQVGLCQTGVRSARRPGVKRRSVTIGGGWAVLAPQAPSRSAGISPADGRAASCRTPPGERRARPPALRRRPTGRAGIPCARRGCRRGCGSSRPRGRRTGFPKATARR